MQASQNAGKGGRMPTLRMNPLRDLSDLKGFDKRWPAKDGLEFALAQNYLLKVNYSIQDFNELLKGDSFPTSRDMVLMVVYVDWISDAVRQLANCYKDEAISDFGYSQQEQLKRAVAYFRAVRSFVVAHPLKTDNHGDFGLGGDLVCADIRRRGGFMDIVRPPFRRVTMEKGLEEVDHLPETDAVLAVYSRRNGALYLEHIGLDLKDVRLVAELKIDRIYEMGKYLSKLKKKDFPSL